MLNGRYSREANFFCTLRMTDELGSAPGKKVRIDVSKSGEDGIAFAGWGGARS